MIENYNEEIYTQLSQIGKAVASPRRLEILDILTQRPHTVESLSKHTKMSIANTSQHLKILANSNLVERHKKGLYVTYTLAGKEITNFFHSLRSLAILKNSAFDRLAKKYLENQPIFKISDKESFMRDILSNDLIIVDVRPYEEFSLSHIKGALSIPLDQIKKSKLSILPNDKDIIVYCRGPLCLLSIKAVEILRNSGFNAFRLTHGVAEWDSEGLPLESELTKTS